MGEVGLLFLLLLKRGGGSVSALLLGMLSMQLQMVEVPPVFLDSQATFLATVDTEPRHRAAGGVELSLQISQRIEGGLLVVLPDGARRAMCRAIDLPWRNASTLGEGDSFLLHADFRGLQRPINPFSYEATLLRHGYVATCKVRYASKALLHRVPLSTTVRNDLLGKVRSVLGDGEMVNLLLSMTLGIRDAQSKLTDDAFRKTGLTHLLVVSGFQVTLVFFFVLTAMAKTLAFIAQSRGSFPLRIVCHIIAAAVALLFVMLTGFDSSSVRALVAIHCVQLSRLLERGGGMLNGMLVSLLVLSLIWPGCICEPGCQLTYAALIGIALALSHEPVSSWRSYVALAILPTICSSAVSLAWFGLFSLGGLLLNPLLAAPVSFLICQAGLAALSFFWLGLDSGAWCTRILLGIVTYFHVVICWLAEFPWISVEPTGVLKLLLLISLVGAVFMMAKQRFAEYLILRGLC